MLTYPITINSAALHPLSGPLFAAIEAGGGNLSGAERGSVDRFLKQIDAGGVLAKLDAFYGLAGGAAGAHAVNWLAPGTWNLTWSGGFTHAATGSQGDGSTGQADSGYAPDDEGWNSGDFGAYGGYLAEDADNDPSDNQGLAYCGSLSLMFGHISYTSVRWGDSADDGYLGPSGVWHSLKHYAGHFCTWREGGTFYARNNAQTFSKSPTAFRAFPAGGTVRFFATPYNATNVEMRCLWIGRNLGAADVVALESAIEALQQGLGRE